MEDIMHYESKIWAIADLLRTSGIKQSQIPEYMMPFFALMMLEGRMLNAIEQIKEEEGLTIEKDPEDFDEAFREKGCGYNRFIVKEGKTLRTICKNDTTFEQDFYTYLNEFDDSLKRLLGINTGAEERFLDMDKYIVELRAKKILFATASAWSEIDLAPYDNSSITTLEEHIKRKWADISASTAGEQYTPDDIISLIAEIVASKINKKSNEYLHIYDPTCGGANLLFGVADRLSPQYRHIATYGSEINGALYALAAIESRFRNNSQIHYGDTLTTVPYPGHEFDIIVANPPYGTKWGGSGSEKEIRNDQKGQFPGGLPSISDGQLLFMQHILWKLKSDGIAVEVHNGSSLFSGDAGSGESNIRKYILDKDWVEAIIQMPQNEFFNAGISTYLWIMNKKKAQDRKDKIALIDASGLWQLLKKAKGDKRREMTIDHRSAIVEALTNYENNDICKILPREHFYYNKQSLKLTEVDTNGNYFKEPFALKNIKEVKLNDVTYNSLTGLNREEGRTLQDKLKAADIYTDRLYIILADGCSYHYDSDKDSIICKYHNGNECALGCGIFKFGLSASKGKYNLKVEITTWTKGDYEIIPYHFDSNENELEINTFMKKYVFKPFTLGDNTVGVELNFNKEFYVPEKIESVENIMAEIKALNSELLTIGL